MSLSLDAPPRLLTAISDAAASSTAKPR